MKYYRWLGEENSEAIREAQQLMDKEDKTEEDLLQVIRLVFQWKGRKSFITFEYLARDFDDNVTTIKLLKKLVQADEVEELEFQTYEEAVEYLVSLDEEKTSVEKVREVKEKYQNILLAIPNVVGVGIGGPASGDRSECYLRIYVEKDVDVMKTILAKHIEGIKVAVLEVGRIVAY